VQAYTICHWAGFACPQLANIRLGSHPLRIE
jgi:hypothetical protein